MIRFLFVLFLINPILSICSANLLSDAQIETLPIPVRADAITYHNATQNLNSDSPYNLLFKGIMEGIAFKAIADEEKEEFFKQAISTLILTRELQNEKKYFLNLTRCTSINR